MKAQKTFTKEQRHAMRIAAKAARKAGEFKPHSQIERYQVSGM